MDSDYTPIDGIADPTTEIPIVADYQPDPLEHPAAVGPVQMRSTDEHYDTILRTVAVVVFVAFVVAALLWANEQRTSARPQLEAEPVQTEDPAGSDSTARNLLSFVSTIPTTSTTLTSTTAYQPPPQVADTAPLLPPSTTTTTNTTTTTVAPRPRPRPTTAPTPAPTSAPTSSETPPPTIEPEPDPGPEPTPSPDPKPDPAPTEPPPAPDPEPDPAPTEPPPSESTTETVLGEP